MTKVTQMGSRDNTPDMSRDDIRAAFQKSGANSHTVPNSSASGANAKTAREISREERRDARIAAYLEQAGKDKAKVGSPAAMKASAIAANKIGAMVKDLRGKFPRLGLSFGYIGDLDRDRDDRSFYIFTNCRRGGRSASFPSFGGFSYTRLPEMLAAVEAHLEAWLQELAADVAKGKAY